MSSALIAANLRYWPTVAPIVGGQIGRWRTRAEAIPSPELKALALSKISEEHFNARVAATLATGAPLRHRAAAAAAIVACQLAYDYLDGLTELPVAGHLPSNLALYGALSDMVAHEVSGADHYRRRPPGDDGGYLCALASAAREQLARLPATGQVRRAALTAARRCGESQARVHASAAEDPAALAAWASEQAQGSPLGWREWLAGGVSSVLGVHALIAAAADRATTPQTADALEAAYLPIAAISTMLDALVDLPDDRACGRTPWLLRLYDGDEAQLAAALSRTARCARERAGRLPHASHHLMTLTGVIAYYASSPAAAQPHARPAFEGLAEEMPGTLAPVLAIMRTWRGIRRGRAALTAGIAAALALGLAGTAVAGHAHRAHGRHGAHSTRATHTRRVRDRAQLKLVGSRQNTLIETGRATGTLPGTVKVHFTLHGLHATSRFTIHARGGSISGVGQGKVKSGRRGYDTFGGSLRLTGGSGRYRGASGSGRLYGSLYKLNESIKVQVYGTLHYH